MLATRIASAVIMAAGFVIADLTLSGFPWAVFVLAVVGLSAWEWGSLAQLGMRQRLSATLALVVACAAAGLWTGLAGGEVLVTRAVPFYAVGAVFWMTVVPAWLRAHPPKVPGYVILAMAFPVLVPAYLALLELRAFGPAVLLLVMAIVWIADTMAYFSGRLFGRTKLAPKISPGKTWEGIWGALFSLAMYGAVLAVFVAPGARPGLAAAVLVGGIVVLGAISVLGDLFESSLKRCAGVKDSGHLIPGHGGVLDRLDAQLAMLPFALIGLQLTWGRT
jgi:phosphatidate cytidylyltransferase